MDSLELENRSISSQCTESNWFSEALYGVFFHWGPYSAAARGEWVMNRERIPADEYQARFIDTWEAEYYDPEKWMQIAKESGASYVVITTRHHDGFALWDSRVNPNNAVRKGPKRDLLAEFVKAARKYGLRICFYYSLANWIHPDYPGPFYRDWPSDEDWASDEARERFLAYNQAELRELLTQYGKIDYLWYDGHFPENIRNDATNTLVRELQPGILINDRNGPTGDIRIAEQGIGGPKPEGCWEACFTLNKNWGYHSQDNAYKQPSDLLDLLLEVKASKGNLLLNLGPDSSGEIPSRSQNLLRQCGTWLRQHAELVTGLTKHDFGWNNSAIIHASDNALFLIFASLPKSKFCWAETEEPLLSAVSLPDNIPVKFKQDGARIILSGLEYIPRSHIYTVIQLNFACPPKPVTPLTTFWIPD